MSFLHHSCPAIKPAIRTNRIFLANGKRERLSIEFIGHVPHSVAKQSGLVYYPGSNDDLSVLFCFPNASIYVLQDPQNRLESIKMYLLLLQRSGIIANMVDHGYSFTFTFDSDKKLLVFYNSFAQSFTPPEIKSNGIDAIIVKAYTLKEHVIEDIFGIYFPFLKKNGFLHWHFVPYNQRKRADIKHIHGDWWIKTSD